MKSDQGCRPTLFQNIVLCGGNTMLKGMIDRFTKELGLLIDDNKIKVIAPPEREYSAWIGGSIVSSLTTFEDMWITKKQYDDVGARIVLSH